MKIYTVLFFVYASLFSASFVHGATSYYDTFDGPNIDLSKWQYDTGAIREGKFWLDKQGVGAWSSRSLRVVTGNITDHLGAKVSIGSNSFTVGKASVALKVGGNYYNDTYDGSGGYNNWEGNIYADIRLQLFSSGNLYVRSVVVRYNNSNGSSKTVLLAKSFSQKINFNTGYALSIKLLGSSLVFSCNEETIRYQVSSPIYPTNKSNRRLIAMVYADEGESGYVQGTFDDICLEERCSRTSFLPSVFILLTGPGANADND